MNVDTAYNIIQFIVNKQQTGGANPARVNLAMLISNLSLFKRYSGIPEQWQPGMPLAKMSYSINTDIEMVMRFFKEKKSLYIKPDGTADLPSQAGALLKESTLTYIAQDADGKITYSEVDICNDIEFQERLRSYVVQADKENPACVFFGTYIEFAPKDLVNVQMVYLRIPRTPVWGFTIVSNRPVYDVSTSIDPEWPEDVMPDFIMLACQQLGVSLQKDTLYAEMQSFKESGN